VPKANFVKMPVAVLFETVRFWVAEKVPFVMVPETLVTGVCF